ncbi:RDD family protein [Alteromonas antoniana]|uniref:RDD family protein n=1 Tax=Alteromonas antoniana TaxID=2803813 RepID=UPI001C46D97F
MKNVNIIYASFWERTAAHFIDLVFMFLIFFPSMMFFGEPKSGVEQLQRDVILQILVPLVLTIWFWRRYSATPGKMLLRLEVLSDDKHLPLTIKSSLIRYFGYTASMLTLGVGLIWALFDAKNRMLHDIISKSVVIKKAKSQESSV